VVVRLDLRIERHRKAPFACGRPRGGFWPEMYQRCYICCYPHPMPTADPLKGEARPGTGTLLRHVLELLDGAVATIYTEYGLSDYRTRYSAIVRTLVAEGPLPIRDLAHATG